MFDVINFTLVSLGILFIKFVDVNDVFVVQYLRYFSFSLNTANICLHAIILAIIKWKNDTVRVHVKDGDLALSSIQSMLNPNSEKTDGEMIETSHYDSNKILHGLLTAVTSSIISLFIHFQFGLIPPLIFQPMLGLGSLIKSELFRLHMFCQSEQKHKDLRRPFKAAESNPFKMVKDLMKQMKKDMKEVNGKGSSRPERKNIKMENRRKVQGG